MRDINWSLGVTKEKDNDNGVYLYKFIKTTNKPIWIAWNDGSTNADVSISSSVPLITTEALPESSHDSGFQINDYSSSFTVNTITPGEGIVTVQLEANGTPKFIER